MKRIFRVNSVGRRLELRRNSSFLLITLSRVKFSRGHSEAVTPRQPEGVAYVSNELSFRFVSKQVFSPQQSLTSVFGMGTGGPSALKTPT